MLSLLGILTWMAILTVAWIFGWWYLTRLFLIGSDHSRFDAPQWEFASNNARPSAQASAVLDRIEDFRAQTDAAGLRQRLSVGRRLLDAGLTGHSLEAEALGVEIMQVDAGGVAAEWICAPSSDPNRRLLYLHGGGFTLGSARSHRYITSELARRAQLSVLAIDYRLMPEHTRHAGIDDCRQAYRWMLNNSPRGEAQAGYVYVAGDSAGGNLALMLIAWLRDKNLRQVNAAIALDPLTDTTLSSPSIRDNVDSDYFLGPSLRKIVRFPRTILAWLTLFATRMRPSQPTLSPLRGSLEALPPIIVQASSSEMLRDDAIRYVNKARHEGTDAHLQLWPEMVHVWHLFGPLLPEAEEALQRIADFIAKTESKAAT